MAVAPHLLNLAVVAMAVLTITATPSLRYTYTLGSTAHLLGNGTERMRRLGINIRGFG